KKKIKKPQIPKKEVSKQGSKLGLMAAHESAKRIQVAQAQEAAQQQFKKDEKKKEKKQTKKRKESAEKEPVEVPPEILEAYRSAKKQKAEKERLKPKKKI